MANCNEVNSVFYSLYILHYEAVVTFLYISVRVAQIGLLVGPDSAIIMAQRRTDDRPENIYQATHRSLGRLV